ncbi:Avirulence (Avh) protein [Phytophthora megakarya]|uniref:Avirulence (Avh) protein n=1 Tax=Phytophthora megakarya TaxID=4795 RepID=A0A225W204_9STRA|nr:Avirulence (Avh) protein [Phytophthora megakarya]
MRRGKFDEERGGLSVPFQEKIKAMFSFSKLTAEKRQEKLQGWLRKEKSADIVFTRLQLDKAEEYFFSKPEFATWIQYTDNLSAKNPKHRLSAISTLTTLYGDDALYKILENARLYPERQDLATKLQTEQLQYWVNTRKDPNKVFHLFKLDNAQDKLFRIPDFTIWMKYVDDFNAKHPEAPTSMFPTLMKYYRDKDIFKMIEDAKNTEGTRAIATKLETERLKSWLLSKKSPDKVLIDMGLGQATDELLANPLFDTWVKYMNAYKAIFSDTESALISRFTQTFGDADATMIVQAMKSNDMTRNIATQLESAQLRMWMNSGKSTDEVFNLLTLNEAFYPFPNQVLLKTWVAYLNFFINENPRNTVALFSALESRFRDRPLNKIINIATQYPGMQSLATKIQAEKIESYLARNESPKKVFELLALRDVGNHVLGTPAFQSWMNYVEIFNKRNPNRQESWILTLLYAYQEGKINRMIETAIQNPRTAEMGKTVERGWMQQWLDWGKSPSEAFLDLKLRDANNQALVRPKFKLWEKYLDDFNKRYPTKTTTMFDTLDSNFNELNLLEVLKVAKENPSTENIAMKLEDALIEKWLAKGTKPEYLYKLHGPKDNANELIGRYVKKLPKRSS